MSVVGIDLGTTNTVVACVRMGRVHVIADEQGQRLLPSVVSFHPNGQVLVGREAKARLGIDGRNTISSVKRLIGRSWHSEELVRARQRFPFEMREGPGQGPLVVARGREYTLSEISAFILKKAKQMAEAALGEIVDKAVITVPAHFNELQRASTKVAGRVAGLEVLRILNEPTAAALAYGLGRQDKERIAVYDFGGGTFDCTLLDQSANVFEVLASAGDTFLGGDDVDNTLAERMADGFLQRYRYDPRTDPQAFARLRLAAEQIKIELSTNDEAQQRLREVAYGVGGTNLDLAFGFTRGELEAIVEPFVERSFSVTQDALSLARLTPSAFDHVILVGGTTRIPLVRRRVEQFFGMPPLDRVNPDEVVAIGAAIQAAALSDQLRRRSIPPPPGGTKQDGTRRSSRPPPLPPTAGAFPTDGVPTQRGVTDVVARSREVDEQARAARLDANTDPQGNDTTTVSVRPPHTISTPGLNAPPPARTPAGSFAPPSRTLPLDGAPRPRMGSVIPDSTAVTKPGSSFPPRLQGSPIPPAAGRPPSIPPPPSATKSARPPAMPSRPAARGPSVPPKLPSTPSERGAAPSKPASLPPMQDFGAIDDLPSMMTSSGANLANQALLAGQPSPIGPDPSLHSTLNSPASDPRRMPTPHGAPPIPPPPATAPMSRPVTAPTPPSSQFPQPFLQPPSPMAPMAPLSNASPYATTEMSGGGPFGAPASPAHMPTPGGTPLEMLPPAVGGFSVPPQSAAPILVDVTPRALVVEVVGGYCDVVIPRNAKIPCERTRQFTTGTDHQTVVRVRVAQGEHTQFIRNTYLGEVELSGIRPAPRGEVQIGVAFELDADGSLRVRATDVATGQEAIATLQLVGLASDESSIVMMIDRMAQQPIAQ